MPSAIVIFTGFVVFAQMYGLGTRQTPGTFRHLLANWSLLFRSFVSILLVVPLVTATLIAFLPLPVYVATGLAILASSPGAPLTTRRSEAAGADFEFVSALQLFVALLAVLYTPLALAAFASIHEIEIEPVAHGSVALQVGMVTLLPASLGWLSALLVPRLRNRHNRIVAVLSKGLYLLFLLALLLALVFVPDLRNSMAIGWSAAGAIVLICVIALVSGFVLGGPDRKRRSGLAVATIARNIGLALFIAELSESTYAAIPTILLFAVTGVCIALPASVIVKGTARYAE